MNIPRKSASARRGYTLMEMLLVQAIIVLMLALSWPALRHSLEKGRLSSSAKQVRNELSRARLTAIERGVPLEFRYTPGGNRFEVKPLSHNDAAETLTASNGQPPRHSATGPDAAANFDEEEEDSVPARAGALSDGVCFGESVARHETSADRDADALALHVPEDAHEKSTRSSDHAAHSADARGDEAENLSSREANETGGWSAPLIFYPNGTASNARIRLAGARELFVDVSLRGLTGSASVGPLEHHEDPQ